MAALGICYRTSEIISMQGRLVRDKVHHSSIDVLTVFSRHYSPQGCFGYDGSQEDQFARPLSRFRR